MRAPRVELLRLLVGLHPGLAHHEPARELAPWRRALTGPRERVGNRLDEWPEREALSERSRDVDLQERRLGGREPERQLEPRPGAVLEQEAVRDPGERGVGAGD